MKKINNTSLIEEYEEKNRYACLLIRFYSLLLSDSRFGRSHQTLELRYDSKHKIEMPKEASECDRVYSIYSKKKKNRSNVKNASIGKIIQISKACLWEMTKWWFWLLS